MIIDEKEYQRLKDIEAAYKLLTEQETVQELEKEPDAVSQNIDVDAAWQEFREGYMNHADAFESVMPEHETERRTEIKGKILSERTYGQMDAWMLLNRLSRIYKITGDADPVPNDNLSMLFADGNNGHACQFTANEYQTNAALKSVAQQAIWKDILQCQLLERVREAKIKTTDRDNDLIDLLREEMDRRNCTLLLAVIHKISGDHHVHVLWMDNTGTGIRIEDLMRGRGHEH